MASNPSLGVNVPSLGQVERDDTSGKLTFAEALLQVSAVRLEYTSPPLVVDKPAGELGFTDLPLRIINPFAASTLENLVDMLVDQGDFDMADVENKCARGQFNELPGELFLRVEPPIPYTMEIYARREVFS